jgi:uncharacterized protein (UPF0332 family)
MKRTLKQWSDNGWLKSHTTTPEEIENLFQIVERDLKDARSGVSADWRFGIAYNAALKLCTILLYAKGYKAERNLQHYRTIQALPKILGSEKSNDASYLDTCRAKRNTAEYDSVGVATERDSDELIEFSEGLRDEVMAYIEKNYPDLLGF